VDVVLSASSTLECFGPYHEENADADCRISRLSHSIELGYYPRFSSSLVTRKGRMLRSYRFPEHCRTCRGTLPDLGQQPSPKPFLCGTVSAGVCPFRFREICGRVPPAQYTRI
jgi:hypothetical protein